MNLLIPSARIIYTWNINFLTAEKSKIKYSHHENKLGNKEYIVEKIS